MKTVGAIDIGSNAIRMACARLREDRHIDILEAVRTPIRLGADVFQHRVILPATIQKLEDAMLLYQRTLTQNHCEEIRAYATSAFRESENQQEVMQHLARKSGIKIEAISGGKEASLLRRAVQSIFPMQKGTYMLADLGGGSIEITILQRGEIQFAESFRLGTVRLLQMLEYKPEQEKIFVQLLKSYLNDFLQTIANHIEGYTIDQLILTGGNATTVAKLAQRFPIGPSSSLKERISILGAEDFRNVKKELTRRTYAQRIQDFGLPEDRADVIIPAIYVFHRLLGLTNCSTLAIPDVGVREGILDEMLEEFIPAKDLSDHEQMLRSGYFYAKKYQADPQHCETVQVLAGKLFDGLQGLHKYGARERIFLELAAVLHDVGRFIRPSDHQKHSMYLIQNMELVGITNQERTYISLLARYHTRGVPSSKHLEYASLTRKEQQLVDTLAAILRIADSLDREHATLVKSLKVSYTAEKIVLSVGSDEDLFLAKWALHTKQQFFEQVFGRRLELKTEG